LNRNGSEPSATTISAAATPAGHSGRASGRRSRITTAAAAATSSPSTIAAVVARPGSLTRNGATTTSTPKPVAPDSHAGRGHPSRPRIAWPISSEAPAISAVEA
jgi:hypothetical protein